MGRVNIPPTFQASLVLLPHHLAVCQLGRLAVAPSPPEDAAFWSLTRTKDEISVILPEDLVPDGWLAERGWRCIGVSGPLNFDLTGVLASLSVPLAEAGIPIFALSTYDTDYVLVRDTDLRRAIDVLAARGHTIETT
jgi:hypothetical protein